MLIDLFENIVKIKKRGSEDTYERKQSIITS